MQSVVPENIHTSTTKGISLITPQLTGFSIFTRNWWPQHLPLWNLHKCDKAPQPLYKRSFSRGKAIKVKIKLGTFLAKFSSHSNPRGDKHQFSPNIINIPTRKKVMRIEKMIKRENALIFYQIHPTNSLEKSEEICWENLNVDIGAWRVFRWCPTLYQVQGQAPSEHLKIRLFIFFISAVEQQMSWNQMDGKHL